LQGLLDIPVLYLSRHIIDTKSEYYQRLQAVRDTGAWEAWILYMLEAVERTSLQTIQMINGIRDGMHATKTRIRGEFSFYSQDLINHLFTQPYTTIALLEKHLSVTRLTATKYLDQLTAAGLLRKEKLGRNNYYVNVALFDLLARSEG
jgi:Fic family protein